MSRRIAAILVAVAVGVGIEALARAQTNTPWAALSDRIGRIFESSEYRRPRVGSVRWVGDGAAYTALEPAPERAESREIVRYDTATGGRQPLVPVARLIPPGSAVPLVIDDYSLSRDGRRVLIFTNSKRVWRRNTRGDYWVHDVDGTLFKLGGDAPASSLMFAKFSPDGTQVAYLRGNDLYVEGIDRRSITRLTSNGTDTLINGTSDWVYEEEFDLRDGFRWSPDGKQIAYWQFDTTGVGTFTLTNTDTLYPTLTRIAYPKAGTTNSSVRLGVVALVSRATRWMKTPGDPREHYLPRAEWLDANTLSIQQLNRAQNRNDLLVADVRTGETRRVFRDSAETWVDVMDKMPWVENGRALVWLSERDGWRHAYRVPREGGEPMLLTRFDADVTEIAGVDEARGLLYVIASPENATERYLYRTRLDRAGTPERVTPAALPGTHTYDFAPGGAFAVHRYSRFDQPPAADIVEAAGHRSLRSLTDASAVAKRLEPLIRRPTEFLQVTLAPDVTLDGWMIKPTDFDPSRRYPTIVFVYGEPFDLTVTDRWAGNTALFNRALADAGYVVVSFDNRGTPAPKGTAWRKAIFGSVGDLSSRDQNAAIKALAAQHRFIDSDRIGVWGWSGGGSNTLNAMFRFPDTYMVGVAVAPAPDQRLYDTIYQERYMGRPDDNVDGYRRGSPINFAEGLKGPLLIVHGTGDDNVHAQGTERLVNRLVELGKPFDLMMYPNRTHTISEGPGTTPHLYRLIARYFLEHLPPGPR
jgi:dipeptidyl-peptidase-4